MLHKKHYSSPHVLQNADIVLERAFLFGSLVDWIQPVEIAGSDVDHVYDFSTDDTFNHEWRD